MVCHLMFGFGCVASWVRVSSFVAGFRATFLHIFSLCVIVNQASASVGVFGLAATARRIC